MAATPDHRVRLASALDYLSASRQAELKESISLRLVSSAKQMLAGARPGGDARAAKQLLAAQLLSKRFDEGAIYSAVLQLRTTEKIVETSRSLTVAFSPDGRLLATGGYNGVRLWDTNTGRPVADLRGRTDEVTSVAFSPDGRLLATPGYGDQTVWLWDPRTDKTVWLWDPRTGEPVGDPLTGHTGDVSSVAFSPDGRLLASASNDGTVRLWDRDTGEPVGDLYPGQYMDSGAFSPDGRLLASASGTTVRLWAPRTGEPVGVPLTADTWWVHCAAFSPDSRLLASGGQDATVRLWRIAGRQDLCAKLTANMSRKQWREWVSPDIPYLKICDDLPIPPDDPEQT